MADLSRLPVPTQEQYQWQYEGACNDVETELFFSPAFERGSRREAREGDPAAAAEPRPRGPAGMTGAVTEHATHEERTPDGH